MYLYPHSGSCMSASEVFAPVAGRETTTSASCNGWRHTLRWWWYSFQPLAQICTSLALMRLAPVWWVYLYKLCMPIMASSSRFIFLCAAQLHNSDSPCVLLVSLCSPKEHNLHDLVEYIYAVTYRPFKPFSPPKFLARSVPCKCLHLVLKQLGWVEQ